jgi:hypothetical protein
MTLQVTLMGDGERAPDGYDSAIVTIPDSVYVRPAMGTTGPARTLNLAALRVILQEATDVSARSVGERLHHGVWTITSDPEQVTTLGLMHDCATCLAAVDQTLVYLRAHPGKEVAVGQLWWAAPD